MVAVYAGNIVVNMPAKLDPEKRVNVGFVNDSNIRSIASDKVCWLHSGLYCVVNEQKRGCIIRVIYGKNAQGHCGLRVKDRLI